MLHHFLEPADERASAIGTYARGCAAGNVELPETGPTWQAMRLSRDRNWGNPVLVDYLEDLSAKVTAFGARILRHLLGDGGEVLALLQPLGDGLLLAERTALLFEIKGVSPEAIRAFSERRDERELVIGSADDHRDHILVYLFSMLSPFYFEDLDTPRALSAAIVALGFIVFLF